MTAKRPEILDCCLLPRERIDICVKRIELALARGNREECQAAIDAAFLDENEPITFDSATIELGLELRTVHILESHSIFTVRDLCEASQEQLLKFPVMGRATVREIVSILKRHGFKLRDVSKFNDRVS